MAWPLSGSGGGKQWSYWQYIPRAGGVANDGAPPTGDSTIRGIVRGVTPNHLPLLPAAGDGRDCYRTAVRPGWTAARPAAKMGTVFPGIVSIRGPPVR